MILYVATAVLAVGFTLVGAAKLAQSPAMTARASHAGFSAQAYQIIGAAEVAGALGAVGGLWFTPVGFAAGAGLLLLMAGAVVTHLRLGDKPAEILPAAAFSLVTLVYLVVLGWLR